MGILIILAEINCRFLEDIRALTLWGIPRDSSLIFFGDISRIHSGVMQVNFTKETSEIHGRNSGSLTQKIVDNRRISNSRFEGESHEIHRRFLMEILRIRSG